MNLRRLLGGVMLFTGVIGIALSISGLLVGRRLVDDIGRGLDNTFATTIDGLQTTREVLTLSIETVNQVSHGAGTLEDTAFRVSSSIEETRPLLHTVSNVTSDTIPASLEAVQDAVPVMTESAAVIDDVLTTLSNFQYRRTVLGTTLAFDLGIDYAPVEPFDVSVGRLGESLVGTPEQLRALDGSFRVTDGNLVAISSDIAKIGDDLTLIGSSIAELNPLLNEYVGLIDQIIVSLEESRTRLADQLAIGKLVLTLVMVWFGLFHLVPLYRGHILAEIRTIRFASFRKEIPIDE